MAAKVSIATGNFTAAATWGVCDTTVYLDSEANQTTLTTSYVDSTAGTTGAITVSHICLKMASQAGTTGTISVCLAVATVDVPGTTVTINTADLPGVNHAGAGPYNGWVAFKLSSPVTLLGATSYTVRAKTSSSSQVYLHRDGTAGNWSRMLVTTTTGAPAASDQLHIMGEKTGAGTKNDFTVTMDNTATTSFGPTVSGGPPQGMTISHGGTLTTGTTAATAYYLKLKGLLDVYQGGSLISATSGARLPATASFVLEFDCVAAADSGLRQRGGLISMYGDNARLRRTTLGADEAAAQTVLTMTATTGWSNGDAICIASTGYGNTSYNECEKRTISTVDSATQVTVSAGLTYAHGGVSPVVAEVGNLTCNIKIRSASATYRTFFSMSGNATADAATSADCNITFDNVEFNEIGSTTSGRYGFEYGGSLKINDAITVSGCTFWNTTAGLSTAYWFLCNSAVHGSGFTYSVDNCVLFQGPANEFWSSGGCGAGTYSITNNLSMGQTASNSYMGLVPSATGGAVVFTGNTFAGVYTGTSTGLLFTGYNSGGSFSVSGNTVHSTQGAGVGMYNTSYGPNHQSRDTTTLAKIGSMTVYFTDGGGGGYSGFKFAGNCVGWRFEDWVMFGCGTACVDFSNSGNYTDLLFKNFTTNGHSSKSTTNGFRLLPTASADIVLEDCDLSTASGSKTACTTDILPAYSSTTWPTVYVTMRNTKLGAATEVGSMAYCNASSLITSQKHDQTAGLHKWWHRYGTGTTDTTTYRTASPAETMTPNSATYKLPSSPKAYYVANAGTITPTVYVYKSAAYNGNQPRLIVRRNTAAGITSDTVLDTMTVAVSNWEALTAATAAVTDDAVLEFYVDCDGTAGACTVDDWSFA